MRSKETPATKEACAIVYAAALSAPVSIGFVGLAADAVALTKVTAGISRGKAFGLMPFTSVASHELGAVLKPRRSDYVHQTI
jgi:hypothetical protein